MKKNIYLILYFIIPYLLVGCQTEGENIDLGYIQVSARIVYPQELNINSYKVICNEKDISESFFATTEKEVKFQVFSKDAGTLELDTIIPLNNGSNNIELIKLPGKKLEIYHEESYLSFSTTLALFDGYKMIFNKQQIVAGLNFIQKEKFTGSMEFYKEGESTPVYSIENVVIEQGSEYIIMQSGESEFFSLSDDSGDEQDPTSRNLTKARFFYAPVGGLNVDAIEVEFISYDASVSVIDVITPSVIVEKGKLSSYIELDIAKYKDTYNSPSGFGYSIYAYDVTTQTRGVLIEDVMNGNNMFNIDAQADDAYKTKYKFTTYQITNGIGYAPKFIMGTGWQQE